MMRRRGISLLLLLLLAGCESHLVQPLFELSDEAAALEIGWLPTAGPPGGRFSALLATGTGQLFAGTIEGWVFRSNDDGATWQAIYNREEGDSIFFIASSRSDVLFLGAQSGLYVSTNQGITWQRITSNAVDGTGVIRPVISFAEDGEGHRLVNISGRLFRFAYPQRRLEPISDLSGVIALAAGREAGEFFAAVQPSGDAYRSTDGGLTWQLLFDSGPDRVARIAVSASGRIFLGMDLGGIFHSTATGWAKSLPALDAEGVYALLAVGERIYTGRGKDLYYSFDDGETWYEAGLTTHPVLSLAVQPRGAVFAGVAGEGLFRSQQQGIGGTWESMRINNTFVGALYGNAAGMALASTEWSGIFLSNDGGDSWRNINTTSTQRGFVFGYRLYDFEWLAADQLAVASTNGIYVTPDQGTTWSLIGLSGVTIRALARTRDETLLAGSANNGVFRRQSGGGWVLSGLQGQRIAVLERNHKGQLFAGTAAFPVSGGTVLASGLYRSDDDGHTWHLLDTFDNESFYELFVGDTDVLYARTETRLFRSSDDGVTWQRMDAAFADMIPLALLLATDGQLFVGTNSHGLYRSMDGGTTWDSFGGDVGRVPLREIAEGPNGRLLLGTHGSGVLVVPR